MSARITQFEIAKLELRDGDKLVVKVDEVLSNEQVAHIREHFRPHLPDSVGLIVFGKGMSLEVLSKAKT
jgi:hypothetical protein